MCRKPNTQFLTENQGGPWHPLEVAGAKGFTCQGVEEARPQGNWGKDKLDQLPNISFSFLPWEMCTLFLCGRGRSVNGMTVWLPPICSHPRVSLGKWTSPEKSLWGGCYHLKLFNFIPIRMAVIKKTESKKCWWGSWKSCALLVGVWNGAGAVESSLGGSLRIITLSSNSVLDTYPQEFKAGIWTDPWTQYS